MRKVALMTKKILVTEDLVQEGIDSLTEHGYEVDMLIDPTAEELASAIAPYDALIVHPNTVVDSSLLDAAENLRIIGRAGVTVDNIDIEAASERGVIVCNAPNSNVISAAEHTMALLLAAARHIPEASASMHEGQWRRASTQIAEYVEAGLEGGMVATAVNLSPLPPEVFDAIGPYVHACKMMGSMASQILGHTPKSLKVELAGGLADADPAPLLAAVLDGGLSYRRLGAFSAANAESVASQHGISVTTASVRDAGEYASSVRIVADEVEVAATLFGTEHTPRIISLMGYKIDIAPATTSLVFEYVDAPGRIGVIGTILGDAAANITTMQIGTKPEESCALVYMNVEGDVSEAVLDRLRGAIDLRNLWKITL